ncbi:hypothetical protein [Neobacillus sp. SuZ13]|uniref:hypothetical protein n=1 Tax=Neobacillus sp. SuZ13 TaxID=3047875 RepID=UPI0024C057AF|nr:hypothetical protein [Neobacillus sp. SuZ13]WHY64750.1 hypothetical protein QNH17_16660 [Neobacillus sp. SuZ13]
MNIQLLEWGLFSFMIGMVLSLPLSAVYYQKSSPITKVFTNARKLKSAHIDFFMQGFALGFAFLLEVSLKTEFSIYIVIPLIYGSIMNPTILLLEATPFIRSSYRFVHLFLRATSPLALLFAWIAIAVSFLPFYLNMLLLIMSVVGGLVIMIYLIKREAHSSKDLNI